MHCPMCTHFNEYLNKRPVEMEKSFETVLIVGDPKCQEVIKKEEEVKAAGYDFIICRPEIIQDILNLQIIKIRYISYPNTKTFFDIKKEQLFENLPPNDLKKKIA